MRLLETFFPANPRPRSVVHAGPLLMKRHGGLRSLRRYLRIPRDREVFLLHRGQEPLREIAVETGTSDITLETPSRAEAAAASEMALALGAQQLDFTIDEPCLRGPDGEALRTISMSEVDRLARDPDVRPRIRTKLRAACAAMRDGLERVRIGDPAALTADRATTLVPDGTDTHAASIEPDPPRGFEWHKLDPRWPSLEGDRTRARAARTRRRTPRYEIGVPVHEPRGALRDAWWRLRGLRVSPTHKVPYPIT